MLLVMNTENTRVLASTYEERSDGALNLQTTLNRSLELAALDDTYDVSGALTALSEELHLGGVVLAHQADIMDGLTVDVDALAEELGVQPWEIRKQLERAEQGKIDLGDVLAPIVNWGDSTTVGLDTTIRDFVPDAPEIGADPEFDALVQRLDGWLLSAVVDGRPLDELLTSTGRQADALALATRMGMQDLSTVIVEYTETRWQGNTDDGRNVTYNLERALDPDEYHEWTFDWLVPKLVDERKLSRLAVVPTLGELFDLDTYSYTYQYKPMGGDEDYVTGTRTKARSAEQIADEIERINTEYSDLAWLPSVLAGLTDPPPDALTPAVLERLRQFAREYGGDVGGAVGDDGALLEFDPTTFIGGRSAVARALENPRPIQKARLPFAAGALDASIEFGRQQGVVTEQHEAEARMMAQYLTGFDPQLDYETITAAELDADAPDLEIQEFVGMLAERIPASQLTENRILQAFTYAQRGETVGDRIERIERAILGFQTVVTVGEPAMTKHDWLSSLPAKVRREHFKTEIEGEEFSWLLEHAGVPGYHKSRDWRRGGGKRYFHLVNDEVGKVDDFIVEKIPKKSGWFGQALMTIAKVAISYVAPPIGVAIAVMDAAQAAASGDWVGAGMAALGALSAGTASWANASGSALSQAAANGARALESGVKAGVAFKNDDVVGGLVNSVGVLAAGANGFGNVDVADNLIKVGNGIQAVDTTVQAIEDGDIAGAIAGGISAGATFASVGGNAAEGLGDISAGTNETLQRIATSAQSTAGLIGSGAGIVRSIEDEQWGALVGQGLRFGSSATNLVADQNGIVSGMLFDRSDEQAFAAATGQLSEYASYGAIAADYADGGLAIANEDYLGGAALISGGTTALLRNTDLESKHFTRLDQLTSIADKVVKAGPDVDHQTLMGLIGDDVAGFVDSFRPVAEAEAVTLPAGAPDEVLQSVTADRLAAEQSVKAYENLLALSSDNPLASHVLGQKTAELTSELGRLRQQEQLAAAAFEAAARAHRPTPKPDLPSHIPVLKPPLPDHLPVFRPEDLFAAPTGNGLLVPGPGGPLLAPPMAIQGAPGPGNAGLVTFDDFPANHKARIYQDWARLGHPAEVVPDWAGDFNVELAGVAPAIGVGPYKVPFGALGVVSFGQETFADGRQGIGYTGKYGTRVGVDGPLPILPGLQVGFSHDNLTTAFDGTPIETPLGGWSFQSIGGTPGVAPNEMYDLANPFQWPDGSSVRLTEFTGDEYHWKIGNSGGARASLFGDEIRHDLDFFQMTNQGELVEIAQGPVDVNVTQPGLAFNLHLRDKGSDGWIPEEVRFGASHQWVNGSASLESAHYGPTQFDAYMNHLLTGMPDPSAPVTYTDAEFGAGLGWIDGTAGKASPKFDNALNVAKLLPHSQWLVANSLKPDDSRSSDFSTSGRFWNTAKGTTITGADGVIDGIEINSAITPHFDGGREIPFTLDTDDYIAFLEAEQFGNDPLEALRGRPNIPDEIFDSPLNRLEMLDTLGDIQEMGAYDELNPHPGNLSVREDHHGNKRLEMTNPYPGMLIDDIAADYPFLNIKNRPIVNHQIRADEVMDGIGQGLGVLWDGAVDAAKYAHYGTAYGGVKLAESIGLGDWVGENDLSNAAVFEQQYLDGTIEAGRQAAGYVSSRATDMSLLVDDAIAFDESVDEWVATTKQAWREGDGEYFGRGIAYGLGGGAAVATGVGAPALAARGATTLGRVAKNLGGRGGRGNNGGSGGPPPGDGGLGGHGPSPVGGGGAQSRANYERLVDDLAERQLTSSGGAKSRANHERYLRELEANDPDFVDPREAEVLARGGAKSRANYERYLGELAAINEQPPVTNPKLKHEIGEVYRPDATMGNRSNTTAARHELLTGRPVGGALHDRKVRNKADFFSDWLEKNPMEPKPGEDVPDGLRSDRAAAENVLRDSENYEAEVRRSPRKPPLRGD